VSEREQKQRRRGFRLGLVLAVGAGAVWLWRPDLARRLRVAVVEGGAELRREGPSFSLVYDWASSVLGGVYASIADEVVLEADTGRVLDVGCGPGRLSLLIAALAPQLEVVGVDVDPGMLARARTRAEGAGEAGRRVSFIQADVGALPFADESFDVVVSSFSMHHWVEVERGLSELRRVVKPTGTVLIYDPPGWFVRVESRGPEIERVIPGAPFGERELAGFASVAGVPFVKKATLRPGPPV
jgi:SAM-dependent methyltransferase